MQWTFNEKKVNNDNKFTIVYYRTQNLSTSTLKIFNLNMDNKGVYKCKYDKVEAKYILDFKSKQLFNYLSKIRIRHPKKMILTRVG